MIVHTKPPWAGKVNFVEYEDFLNELDIKKDPCRLVREGKFGATLRLF